MPFLVLLFFPSRASQIECSCRLAPASLLAMCGRRPESTAAVFLQVEQSGTYIPLTDSNPPSPSSGDVDSCRAWPSTRIGPVPRGTIPSCRAFPGFAVPIACTGLRGNPLQEQFDPIESCIASRR